MWRRLLLCPTDEDETGVVELRVKAAPEESSIPTRTRTLFMVVVELYSVELS